MFQLSNFIGEELILIQLSFRKREYELRRGDEILAKMYFPKLFSTIAIVELLEEKYEIIRPSIWKKEIAIKKFGYDLIFASASTNLFRTKGKIDLQNGCVINLKLGKFNKSCQVFDESNELLILFRNKFSFKDKNIVTVEKKSELIDKNPWIVMMVWYLILQSRRNSAAR
ncbi:MAG: hypothetical protein ABI638_08555 [Ignavibacteriota bacterium]